MNALRESGRYLFLHLPHLVVAPCLALTLVTFLHELAHAAAALVQGATVTSFRFLPGAESFGHMSYEPPAGSFFVPALVSLAPCLLWSTFAGGAAVVALFRPKLPYAFASTLFVWFYVVPLLDIAMAVAGWILGSENDLTNALGRSGLLDAFAVALAAPVVFATSFLVQRGLYGERALSVPGYLLVSGFAVLALVAFAALYEVATAVLFF